MIVLFSAAVLFSLNHLSNPSEMSDISDDMPSQIPEAVVTTPEPEAAPANNSLFPFVDAKEEKKGIRNLVETYAKLSQESTQNPDYREEELLKAAKSLTENDIQLLKGWLFDSTQDNANRSVSMYLLAHAGLGTAGVLSEFINTSVPAPKLEDPHSLESQQYAYETTLKITALEALDKLSLENEFLVAPLLENIAASNPDSTLRLYADIALSGIETGRPNKLSRYIDETLKEHGE
jgi:hypothetical protein